MSRYYAATEEELEEIRARAKAIRGGIAYSVCHYDVPFLLQEIFRLKYLLAQKEEEIESQHKIKAG